MNLSTCWGVYQIASGMCVRRTAAGSAEERRGQCGECEGQDDVTGERGLPAETARSGADRGHEEERGGHQQTRRHATEVGKNR